MFVVGLRAERAEMSTGLLGCNTGSLKPSGCPITFNAGFELKVFGCFA